MDKPSLLTGATLRQKCGNLGRPETTLIALVCSLYRHALGTFAQLRADILSGLCRDDFLLPRLWHFIVVAGGVPAFLDLLGKLRLLRTRSRVPLS